VVKRGELCRCPRVLCLGHIWTHPGRLVITHIEGATTVLKWFHRSKLFAFLVGHHLYTTSTLNLVPCSWLGWRFKFIQSASVLLSCFILRHEIIASRASARAFVAILVFVFIKDQLPFVLLFFHEFGCLLLNA
jgi:hypothetical protein